MNILEKQAWMLQLKLRQMVEAECFGRGSRSVCSVRKERLRHAYLRAVKRAERRGINV